MTHRGDKKAWIIIKSNKKTFNTNILIIVNIKIAAMVHNRSINKMSSTIFKYVRKMKENMKSLKLKFRIIKKVSN
jgi:hypothetical protein